MTRLPRHSLMMAAALLAASPVDAAVKAPVNKWFCEALLKRPFDPVAAIRTFPLEEMPEPEETREQDEDGERTSVELTAEGEDFEVSYGYSFLNDDVTDTYGYGLQVYAKYPKSEEMKPLMDKWLKEFGKPERAMLGMAVFAGPELYAGGEPVFHFTTWTPSSAVMEASWFNKGDIVYAEELCD